jgi:hypothetical protein
MHNDHVARSCPVTESSSTINSEHKLSNKLFNNLVKTGKADGQDVHLLGATPLSDTKSLLASPVGTHSSKETPASDLGSQMGLAVSNSPEASVTNSCHTDQIILSSPAMSSYVSPSSHPVLVPSYRPNGVSNLNSPYAQPLLLSAPVTIPTTTIPFDYNASRPHSTVTNVSFPRDSPVMHQSVSCISSGEGIAAASYTSPYALGNPTAYAAPETTHLSTSATIIPDCSSAAIHAAMYSPSYCFTAPYLGMQDMYPTTSHHYAPSWDVAGYPMQPLPQYLLNYSHGFIPVVRTPKRRRRTRPY